MLFSSFLHHCLLITQDVLVFPSDDCITVEQWAENAGLEAANEQTVIDKEHNNVRKIVFIDCTWNQIHGIMKSQQLAGMLFCILLVR